jgi:hypothetical protein
MDSTVAAYDFNWMTAYVSKHSRIVSSRVLRTVRVLCLAYLRACDLAIATLIFAQDQNWRQLLLKSMFSFLVQTLFALQGTTKRTGSYSWHHLSGAHFPSP